MSGLQYLGCREFVLIAAECEQHAGLHVNADHLVVELVDSAGRGVTDGRATSSYRFAQLGDAARSLSQRRQGYGKERRVPLRPWSSHATNCRRPDS